MSYAITKNLCFDGCIFLISSSPPLCAEFPAASVPPGTSCPGKCLDMLEQNAFSLVRQNMGAACPAEYLNALGLLPFRKSGCVHVSAFCPAVESSPPL